MKKIMHNIFVTFSLGLLLLIGSPLAISCSSEDDAQPAEVIEEEEENEPAIFEVNDFYISNLTVTDYANSGTSEDLKVTFSGASLRDSISEYRIILIKSNAISQVNLDALLALDNDQYVSITEIRNSYETILPASLLDFDGNSILENVEYKVAVLTVGQFNGEVKNVLSDYSEVIVIDYDLMVSTLVSGLLGNDAVTIDGEGNIYVSNFGSWTSNGGTGTHVLKITPTGESSVFVDGLVGPLGTAFDSEGNFYIINANNGSKGEVIKVSSSGEKMTLAEIDGWPAGIAIDDDNNLFISNYSAPYIHKISNTGELTVFATDASLNGCVGIDFNSNGELITANYNNGKIIKVDMSGNVDQLVQITGLPSQFAIGYMTIVDDKVYATGIGNNLIYEIQLDGEYSVFAGSGSSSSTDGFLLNAGFKNPNGIGYDPLNDLLYVVDWGSNKLRTIEMSE